MRNYELVCILHPDLDEAAFSDSLDKIKSWISEADGSVEKVDIWGRRKMAYMIQKKLDGQYVLLNVKMLPDTTAEFERKMRFLEPVMRHLLVLVD